MNPLRDLALTILGKRKTETGRWLGRERKAIREAWIDYSARLRYAYHWTRKKIFRALKAVRRELSLRRARDRSKTRLKKLVERSSEILEERRAERLVRRAVRGRGPVMIGPWISEVGYEVLYWIPYLQSVRRRHKRLERDRIVVVSRGGVASWYSAVADDYLDMFELMSVEEFARLRNRRMESRETQKQFELSPLDREVFERVKERLGIEDLAVLHPSFMYRMFNHYWYGRRPFRVLWDHTRYLPQEAAPPDPTWGLPDSYVAVKFYSGVSMPDEPWIRACLRRIVARLAERSSVVLLDTGMVLDDHEDFAFRDHPNVVSARPLMQPKDNLDVQTRIIAASDLYVGTCGSLAWLAPMLGVDTVALFADPDFLHTHIRVGLRAYESLDRGRFTPMDLRGIDNLGVL